MAAKTSAGILIYRRRGRELEIFLVHPGGPYWTNKDTHGWSIPKGEIHDGEEPEPAARREFYEETGQVVTLPLHALGRIRASGSKYIHVFAAEGDVDAANIKSNHFEMEWPPRSGEMRSFPEVDKAAWFNLEVAKIKLHKGQVQIIERLRQALGRI